MTTYGPIDTRARLTASQRFFARLASFDLECPHCGDVYQIRQGTARKSGQASPYDPWTARFKCTNKECGRVYVLGLLAWPIGQGGGGKASQPPEDQVPTPRQVAQMRKEGGGWWLPESSAQKYKRPLETNLTTEEERPDAEDDDD